MYQKIFTFHVTVRRDSSEPLDALTPLNVADEIRLLLERGLRDDMRIQVEQAPCHLSQLIVELAKLQHLLECIKAEVAK